MTTVHPSPAVTILFFTKAPRPGKVKTRLAKDTGDAYAARLHAAFVETLSHMLERAAEELSRRGITTSLVLARADESFHPLFDEDILEREGADHRRRWTQHLQRGEDLGERLAHALISTHTQSPTSKILILGSDSPTLTASMLVDAVEQLERHDVVLGPSFDGGYYLIGLSNTSERSVFERITWSSSEVLGQTLERCREADLDVKLLPFWYDVDTIEDLVMLRTHLLQYLVASPAAQHYSSVVKELESLSAAHQDHNRSNET